jgi:hypothetical protein
MAIVIFVCLERPRLLTADEIVQHLTEADSTRRIALKNYSANRLYLAGNKSLGKSAEVAVVEYYSAPGRKQLTVVSERGSPVIVRRVLEKAIEAETESSQDGNLNQTRLTRENYRFRLIGSEIIDARPCYILAVTPIVAGKYFVRGQVWVDQIDFAIIKIEGSPAKNPSFWTRKSHFMRRYEKHGQFWLPSTFDSDAEVVIFGKSTLRIEYTHYQVNNLQ